MSKLTTFLLSTFLMSTYLVNAQSIKQLEASISSELPVNERLRAYVKLCDKLVDKDMAASLKYAESANKLLKRKRIENEVRVEVWRVYGNALVRNGQLSKGLEIYKKNLHFRDSLGLTKGLGLVYRNLGSISSFQRNHADALYYSSLALNTTDAKNDTSLLASLHLNIGCIHFLLSDHDVSIDHIMKSMKLSRKIKDTLLIADNSLQLGNLLKHAKSYENAIEYYREALWSYQKLKMYKPMTMAYHNLSGTFAKVAQYDSALIYVKKAQELWIQIGDYSTLVSGLLTEADIYHMLGNLPKAIELSKEALSYSEQSEDIGKRVRTLNSLCFYSLEEKDYQSALKWGTMAYRDVEKTNSFILKLKASEQLAKVYQKLGNYSKSSELYEISLEHKDSVESARSTEMMMKREALYSFDRKKAEIASLKAEGELKSLETQYERKKASDALLFRNVVIISSVLLIIMLFFLFRSKQQNQRSKFTQKVSELEMKAMQSQMNPHFIYNALNSIQGLINKNDKHGANLYLSKFAMLLRKILEFSDLKQISVGAELETLELYIELERLRFPFDYQFNVDNSVDLSNIEIPSLLFQPFIENAIHHGMRNSEKNGMLTLNLKTDENELVCIVEDNGVGRTEAAKRTQTNNYKGQSYGTQLSQERLNVLVKDYGERPIQIEDLDPQSGEGTRVIIRIPIEHEA